MNFKAVLGKCPKCSEQFSLGDALEEQAIEQILSEMSALNDEALKQTIETERDNALSEARKIASQEFLEQTKNKQNELEKIQAELNKIRVSDIEKTGEINRIKQQQQSAISITLAEKRGEWEAEKTKNETALKLQIQQLTTDLKAASERANQGSMQVQGEVGEISIEDTLLNLFPLDEILEVKKGQRGADCVLNVKNNLGRTVGKILFESKDTKTFSSDWVPKLKKDAIAEGAQIAVLITTSRPSDTNKAHIRDGVWVCGFHEYPLLVKALRQSLMDVAKVTASEGAREGKAQVMYDFLTSQEFAHTVEQMIGPIFRMNEQLQKEQRAIRRSWKERETLIEQSISGTELLYMKIQGIAQVNLPSIRGLEAIEDISGASEELDGN
jgi:hypothetical protein